MLAPLVQDYPEDKMRDQSEIDWRRAVLDRLFTSHASAELENSAISRIEQAFADFAREQPTGDRAPPSAAKKTQDGRAKALRKASRIFLSSREAALVLQEFLPPLATPEPVPTTQALSLQVTIGRVLEATAGVLEQEPDDVFAMLRRAGFRFGTRERLVYALVEVWGDVRQLDVNDLKVGDHTTQTGMVGFLVAACAPARWGVLVSKGFSPASLRRSAAGAVESLRKRAVIAEEWRLSAAALSKAEKDSSV